MQSVRWMKLSVSQKVVLGLTALVVALQLSLGLSLLTHEKGTLFEQLDELYKTVDASDPAIAELAKQKAAMDAERQRKREEARAAKRRKREKKPREKKEK